MNSSGKMSKLSIVVLSTIVASIMTLELIPHALAANTIANPSIYLPGTKPYGLTYGEWSAKWWQWALSIPKTDNPMDDDTGKDCNRSQNGPVWFLAGTGGGQAQRSCVVPSGKAILIPILNAECSTAEFPNFRTDAELRLCSKSGFDVVTNVDAIIDGVHLRGLDKYNTESPPFTVIFPENNVYGVAAGPSKAVSYGYWILLKPLSIGKHQIEFSGANVDYTESGTENFALRVKYQLTVG
jgi:hypothetical protein